jgi:tetratricopeptide (TPR) repeat protein/tRNA A-37 threonylcarbamoyl transferase component Bud32
MKSKDRDVSKYKIYIHAIKHVFVLFTLVLLFFVFIYPENIQDLEKKLEQAPDSGKSIIFNKLSDALRQESGDKDTLEIVLEYAHKALEYAKEFKQADQEVYALANIAHAYWRMGHYDRALPHAKKCLERAENRKNKTEILNALELLGFIYSEIPDYPKAVDRFKRMARLYSEMGDKEREARIYNAVGNLYWKIGEMGDALDAKMKALELYRAVGNHYYEVMMMEYIGMFYSKKFYNNEKALEYYLEAAKIGEREGVIIPTCRVYMSLGEFYKDQKNYEKSSQYLEKAIKICKDTKDKKQRSWLITAYSQKGELLEELKDYDRALVYLNHALKLEMQYESVLFTPYDNPINILIDIGQVHYKKGEFQTAITNYKKALDYALELQLIEEQAFCYKYIGEIQLARGDLRNASVNLDKSLAMAKKIKETLLIKDNYNLLTDLYQQQGNYKKALDYHRLYADLKDKIYDEQSAESLAEMQTRYETEKKEREIELLKKNDQVLELTLSRQRLTIIVFIIGFVLIVIVSAYFVKKYYYLLSFWKKKHYIGNYKVMDKIASGGMGIVYKAHEIRDRSKVYAVKVLREEFFDNETHKKRFKHEGSIIDEFNHPNIIKITERGESGGNLYIVMELIDGRTLSVIIEEEGMLPVSVVLNILTQVFTALVKIHQKNIIHRDLKPENIMLVETPENPHFVKLLDFGLAKTKAFSRLTQTGMVLGTIYYLSPEQVMDSEITAAGDVYAMGVIGCEMLIGRKPFDGETEGAVVGKILENKPLPLSDFRSDIPAQLDQLLTRMIGKDPAVRPSTEEVLVTLNKIQV